MCGISPGTVANAFFDWWLHLALSPGKQLKLLHQALETSILLTQYSSKCLMPGAETKTYVTPLPQDRRFKYEEWNQWPYNSYQQNLT